MPVTPLDKTRRQLTQAFRIAASVQYDTFVFLIGSQRFKNNLRRNNLKTR